MEAPGRGSGQASRLPGAPERIQGQTAIRFPFSFFFFFLFFFSVFRTVLPRLHPALTRLFSLPLSPRLAWLHT